MSPALKKTLDSLKHELSIAKYDSTKVRLKYWIGLKTMIPRLGFWDSLRQDAIRYNYKRFEGKALNTQGYFLHQNGLEEKAQANFLKSLIIAEEVGNKADMLSPLINIGTYYKTKNKIKKALEFFFKGLRIAEETKNVSKKTFFLSEIGDCYFFSGEYAKALEMHLDALKVYYELKDKSFIATTLSSIGTDYRALKKDSLAIFYYLSAKQYLGEFSQGMSAVEMNNTVGEAYHMQKNYDSALKYCLRAYNIALLDDNKKSIVSTINTVAEIYFETGKIKQAQKMTEEALDILKTYEFPVQIPLLAMLLKKIHLKNKNYEGALKAYELYVTSRDSVSNENNRKLLMQKQFDYEIEKKENEVKLLSAQNQVQNLKLNQRNYLIVGLALVLLLVLLVAYLIVQQNRIKVRQQRVEFTQKLLRSQINPHFMSNCLSAIQGLMLSGKVSEAAEYQAKFSIYLRQILDTSENYFISIDDELNSIKLYLELEQLRFENKFEFVTDIEAGLAVNELLVPSFITQPFIENAIWHGLLPLKNKTQKLCLKVYTKDKFVFFEVEDNGVGRNNSRSLSKKTSKGTRLVMDNLRNMNSLLKSNDNLVEIIDLFDGQKQAAGTKVIIRLKRYTLDD